MAVGIVAGTQTLAHANAAPQPLGDYTGDHKTDITVWRPSDGTWYSLDSTSGGGFSQQWGLNGDIPISADFSYGGTTDGKADRTVWRPSNGTWYWIDSLSGGGLQYTWGLQGDIPVTGDFDGDGKSDIAVWRPFKTPSYAAGMWHVVKSSNWGGVNTQWGIEGDIPVACDYDGDGKTDYAVWRPSTATWYVIDSSTGGSWSFTWGQQGDIPTPGNYDGDSICDVAIWRPGTATWWVVNSSTWSGWTQAQGTAGDIPSQADYDGDGKTDLVVWRPSNFTWYGIRSSNGSSWSTAWGSGGPNGGGIGSDVPLPNLPGNKNYVADVLVPQQQSNWCWAATTEMVAEYYNVPISQCQEANVNTGRSDCCTNAASASDTTKCNQGGWWTLTSHGFTLTDLWNSNISFTTLQNEINANRPIPFAWAWTGGGGHAMVVIKSWVATSGAQWVTINNPLPVNVGAQTDMLYTNWISATGYTHWRDSYNVIRVN